jgi:hypothetical protein
MLAAPSLRESGHFHSASIHLYMPIQRALLLAIGVSALTACTRVDEVVATEFIEPTIESLSLAVPQSEADSSARIRVTATVSRGSNGDRPLVTFTTSAGTFAYDGTNLPKVTTLVNDNDSAIVLLRPSTSRALAVVRASTGTHYRQESIQFVVSGLRKLEPSLRTVAADGASIVALRGYVEPTAIGLNRDVSFTSSGGVLLGTTTSVRTVTADIGHVAIASLQAPRDSGLVFVQATAGGVTLRDSIRFVVARPDELEISAPLTMTADQSTAITITTRVSRMVGLPDRRTRVAFTATKSDGTKYGEFGLASAMGDDGKVTITFVSTDMVYNGPVTIKAVTDGSQGQLQDEATITVKPK